MDDMKMQLVDAALLAKGITMYYKWQVLLDHCVNALLLGGFLSLSQNNLSIVLNFSHGLEGINSDRVKEAILAWIAICDQDSS